MFFKTRTAARKHIATTGEGKLKDWGKDMPAGKRWEVVVVEKSKQFTPSTAPVGTKFIVTKQTPNPHFYHKFDVGTIITLVRYDSSTSDRGFYYGVDKGGVHNRWYVLDTDVEIYVEPEAPAEPKALKFSVGKKYIVTGNTNCHGFKIGGVVKLAKDDGTNQKLYRGKCLLGGGTGEMSFYVFDHELMEHTPKRKMPAGTVFKIKSSADYHNFSKGDKVEIVESDSSERMLLLRISDGLMQYIHPKDLKRL